MNYSIIPLLLILLSLTILVVILFRKYPQLTILDVGSIPELKEAKKKDEILKKRSEKQLKQAIEERTRMLAPVWKKFKNFQLAFRKFVGRVERIVVQEAEKLRKREPKEAKMQRREDLRSILNDGNFALEQGNIDVAEKKYISAIRLDTKNKEAYRGLAEVYSRQGLNAEAKETLLFMSQLDPQDDQVFAQLGDLAEKDGQSEEAVKYYEQAVLLNDSVSIRFAKLGGMLSSLGQYQTALEAIKQALELEPQNPKYLDSLVETSVLLGDKQEAEVAFERLRLVNPENQKLSIFRDKIDGASLKLRPTSSGK